MKEIDRPKPERSEEAIDALVERARKNPSDFGELYERYIDIVYKHVYFRVGRNVQDTEEVTSRIFFRALNRLNTYKKRPNVPFAAWLFKIAHNCVFNFKRDEVKRLGKGMISLNGQRNPNGQSQPYLEMIADRESLSPEAMAIKRQEIEEIRKLVSRLPRRDYDLLILKNEGLSNREIAEIQGTTEGAIKSRHHRVLVNLRQRIKR